MSASNTRKAYQLKGLGSSVNGWPFKAYSRDIFVTREDAANHIPEFTRRCTSPDYNPVEHACEEGFAVNIIELDLNGCGGLAACLQLGVQFLDARHPLPEVFEPGFRHLLKLCRDGLICEYWRWAC